jgi:chromosome partitioning protein
MKTIVLANHKGGVGKSAFATLLAHYFVRKGRRVLAIDLDHQGNLSGALQKSGRVASVSTPSEKLLADGVVAVPEAPFVLVPSGDGLLDLERQPALHNSFARNFRSYLASVDQRFDACVVDTHPNPDIRLIAALASTDFVLSPIELKQEAMEGVAALLDHERVGLRKIKAVLNPKLHLIGLLPTMVEATPFQRANLIQVVTKYRSLLIPLSDGLGDIASIPRRSAISEAQADGMVLWEMKKTAARDAWREIEPSTARIAAIVLGEEVRHAAAA